MNTQKTIGYLIIIVALLTGCKDNLNHSEDPSDSQIIYAAFSPQTQQKQHQISAFVQALDQAQLGFQVPGRLSEQWVEIGQAVNQGDDLLSLYNPALAPQIDRLNAQIKANQAELTQTQAELERNQSLSSIQAISQNQLDRLASQVEQLQAQHATLSAQLQEAQNNFQETTLKAPFSGEVADILVKAGTMVQAGQPVITLSGSEVFEAPLYISHDLLKHLTVKQQLNAFIGQQTFTVTVKEISRAANPASQLFKVLVSIDPKIRLLAGEKIELIIKEPIDHIYQLPVNAVIDDGINEPYIYSLENNVVKKITVGVVDFYQNQVWVTIDQHKGDVTIVTDGQSTLTPQQTVPSV